MFTETIIAAFLLGAIVGGTYIWVMCFRPVAKQLRSMEYRNLRTERQRLYRAEYRRQHLGPPYIAQPRNGTARTFEYVLNDTPYLVDDHNGSRKALEVVR